MLNISTIGNLTKDAEKRTTQSGAKVLNFSIAVNTGWGDNKSVIYFDISYWGKDSILPYLKKGQKVGLSGDLTQREYNEKTYLGITARAIDLVGGGDFTNTSQKQTLAINDIDDEIPF
jgi:single-strand DNA-binding protein